VNKAFPTGTVTFLFTDVEGSTKLLDELGAERYAEALGRHRQVLRDAVTRQSGVEVDTQGDAFFVAFPTAPSAIAAAQEAQETLAIPVRMGIHTGTPLLTDEGYVGSDVHKAARIAAAGHGRQVLVSASTAALLDAELTDLGEHRLKDLSAPERIYQLGDDEFPPLKTVYRTNLPIPATPFLGREHELAEMGELLARDDLRLLTLLGPGGTGKTRLALQAAAEAAERYPDGVFWVPLAPLRDPALVLDAASRAVGASDGLAEHIADKRLLLLLDNFEHLIAAAFELAPLLQSCPNLSLVVTSRELLQLAGEQSYPVPPLEPDDSIRLFLARAQAVKPSFEPDEAVPALCERLDNLPLALELAAARVRMLSPQQLLERLTQRLDLLKAGRDADPRQQTLRATIKWSYDLLDKDEQRLFARFAVFADGCTLDAAEAVCDADLETLQSHVDKSLIRVRDEERFWMLETIREYALERFEESGEADERRGRHAEYFLALVEEAEPRLYREANEGGAEWLDRVEAELDNVRAALDWFDSRSEVEAELHLSGAVGEFWCARQHVQEGRRYLERALSKGGDASPARAKALMGAAHMARDMGDAAAARARAEEAVALHRRAGDAWLTAYSLFWLGQSLADGEDFGRAAECHEEASRLFDDVGDEHYALLARRMLGWALHGAGEDERARELGEENLRRAIALGSLPLQASIFGGQVSRAVRERRRDQAVSLRRAT
jgi:predicted ATPase